jgi:hypothetical protein
MAKQEHRMTSIAIAEIFAQFSYYQAHYQHMISHPAHYRCVVEDAYIELYPGSRITLQLGDLLQLWHSQHWAVAPKADWLSALDGQSKQPSQQFVYQIRANFWTGQHQAKLWDQQRCQSQNVELDSLLKYMLTYLMLTKSRSAQQLCC